MTKMFERSQESRGTGSVPTIDAAGIGLNSGGAEKLLRSLGAAIGMPGSDFYEWAHAHCHVEIHPTQLLKWENASIYVEVCVVNDVAGAFAELDKTERPQRKFAGFPLEVSLDYPKDEIRVVSNSQGKTSDGTPMDRVQVVSIINLE